MAAFESKNFTTTSTATKYVDSEELDRTVHVKISGTGEVRMTFTEAELASNGGYTFNVNGQQDFTFLLPSDEELWFAGTLTVSLLVTDNG